MSEIHRGVINDMFERFVDACLTLVHKAGVKELSPTTDSNLVVALMSLIDCQIDEFKDEAKINQLEEREIITWLEVIIMFFHISGLRINNLYEYFTHIRIVESSF